MDKQLEAMRVAHRFGVEVAEALNHAGVKVPEGFTVALMSIIVVDDPERKRPAFPPIGGSINYKRDSSHWELDPEMTQSIPYEEGDHDAH